MSDSFFAKPTADALPATFHVQQATRPKIPSQHLWRDGKQIVIVGSQFIFPPVCIKTGKTENLIPTPHTAKYLKNSLGWMIMFGAVGAMLAQATVGSQVKLNLPVSAEWLKRKHWHFSVGIFTALAAFAFFVLCVAVVIFIDPSHGGLGEHVAIPMLLSMFVGFAGLIYMAAAGSYNLLSCSRMEGNCVWLDGASDDFLQYLPEWSTMGPAGAPGVLRRG
jgi:hypothetical protein